MKKLKIAVLVSGNGSNLQVLIDKQLNGELAIDIVGVISNKQDAYALTRAKNADIATFVIDKDEQGKTYKRVAFEQSALAILKQIQPDLVVLAGFMRILTPVFIHGVNQELNVPMINLHPSLLPNYKGLDTHTRVLKAGERYHGCSVHLVTEELDAGAVLTQAVLEIGVHDSSDILQKRVQKLEHQLIPLTISLFLGKVININSDNHITSSMPLPMRLIY